MTHLDDMPYTNAFMTEMLRIRIPGPLGLAHRAMEATKLMGYDIPKDTQVITNFWAVHHDPKIWGDPEEFRPERFLDADGKFVKPTHLVAFSMGSRYCMGESIARMEFFIFVVVMLQRYHLLLARDDSPPINEECLRSGQFLVPPSHEMRVKERFSREKSIMEYNQQMWDD
uniref:Uncharacterized protein n=1 Tax=Ciona savignyi TaxID=51511 RepID=H2Y7N8_CIOSA